MAEKNQVNGLPMTPAMRSKEDTAAGMGVSQCATCQHKWPGSARCWAFPGGIPETILKNETVHDAPFPHLHQEGSVVWTKRRPDWPEGVLMDDPSDPGA